MKAGLVQNFNSFYTYHPKFYFLQFEQLQKTQSTHDMRMPSGGGSNGEWMLLDRWKRVGGGYTVEIVRKLHINPMCG